MFLWWLLPKRACETIHLSFPCRSPPPPMTILLTPFWVCDSLGTGSSSYLRGRWIYSSCNHFHSVRHNTELIKSVHLYSARVSGLKSLQDVGLTAFVNSVRNLVLEKETLQLHLYPLLSPFRVPERCQMAEERMKITLVFISGYLIRSARPTVLI